MNGKSWGIFCLKRSTQWANIIVRSFPKIFSPLDSVSRYVMANRAPFDPQGS